MRGQQLLQLQTENSSALKTLLFQEQIAQVFIDLEALLYATVRYTGPKTGQGACNGKTSATAAGGLATPSNRASVGAILAMSNGVSTLPGLYQLGA